MTIQDSIDQLKAGNARFMDDLLHGKLHSERRNALVEGQKPHSIVLSCADSRVVPEFTFDTGLGEIFVIRVAGNVANNSTVASIEYAITNLGSNVIIVLGHQNCGAITAAIDGGDNGYHLNYLLSYISPAISACKEGAKINEVVKKNAQLTVAELQARSAIIKEALDVGSVKAMPAYYNLDTGKVDFL